MDHDYQQKQQCVLAYIDALNHQDMTAIETLYAETATVEDPYGTDAKVGLEAIKTFYQQAFDAGLRAQLNGTVKIAGDTAAFSFVVYFNGMQIDVIDTFTFNKTNKVQSMKAYWSQENMTQDQGVD